MRLVTEPKHARSTSPYKRTRNNKTRNKFRLFFLLFRTRYPKPTTTYFQTPVGSYCFPSCSFPFGVRKTGHGLEFKRQRLSQGLFHTSTQLHILLSINIFCAKRMQLSTSIVPKIASTLPKRENWESQEPERRHLGESPFSRYPKKRRLAEEVHTT